MVTPLTVLFAAGSSGSWRIDDVRTIVGDALLPAARLDILEGSGVAARRGSLWALRATTSNKRYATASEVAALASRQQGLSRPYATRAALIPIRKSDAWWGLAQDERRAIFEDQSRHTAIGLEYLPAVARRLHHCRELGEPFDFLTWFEFAPEHENAFDALVRRLRETPEWRYVEREVEIRLTLDESPSMQVRA